MVLKLIGKPGLDLCSACKNVGYSVLLQLFFVVGCADRSKENILIHSSWYAIFLNQFHGSKSFHHFIQFLGGDLRFYFVGILLLLFLFDLLCHRHLWTFINVV